MTGASAPSFFTVPLSGIVNFAGFSVRESPKLATRLTTKVRDLRRPTAPLQARLNAAIPRYSLEPVVDPAAQFPTLE